MTQQLTCRGETISGEKRKPPAMRQVPLVEFASYTQSLLRSLATSAEKFEGPRLASLLKQRQRKRHASKSGRGRWKTKSWVPIGDGVLGLARLSAVPQRNRPRQGFSHGRVWFAATGQRNPPAPPQHKPWPSDASDWSGHHPETERRQTRAGGGCIPSSVVLNRTKRNQACRWRLSGYPAHRAQLSPFVRAV